MDKKILAELILENKRLIIPNTGAFLHKENSSTGITITFSPFLKYNDGTLEQLLVQKLNVSKSDAILLVKGLSDEIQTCLKDSGQYPIPGIGILAIDSKGNVILIESNEKLVSPNSDFIPKTQKTETKINSEIVRSVTGKDNDIAESANKNIEIAELSEQLGNETTIIIEEPPEPFFPEKDEIPSGNELQPNEDTLKKTDIHKSGQTRKRRIPLTLIFFVVSFCVIITFAFIIRELAFAPDENIWQQEFRQDKKIEPIRVPESNNPSNDEIDKEFESTNTYSSSSESTVTKSEDSKPEAIIEENLTGKPTPVNSVSGAYSIVMGSFTDPNNAKRFAGELKDKGLDSEIISQSNGKNIVVVGRFATREQAEKMKRELAPAYPGVWIIKR